MTSPANEGYQLWNVSDTRSHMKIESTINHFRMGLAVGATMALYGLHTWRIRTLVVTPKPVLVVTEYWKPVDGARVRQTWQHYSLAAQGHEQDLKTNGHGRAIFPSRTIRASA